jgi:hypothetical protein
VRHESNMREAEQERLRMAASIEKLEDDKRELEASNAKTIEENRYLLNQLENLNNTVCISDAHIKALEETLHNTREELQRLTVLAGRTAQLEAQLSTMETEQAALQTLLTTTEAENRTAIQRWQRAERTIEHLQDQVDRIEREAREERARHVEVLGRMERQRAVEKELESAAGRLKGAAAISTLGRNQPAGTSVVSHFVKDILQDNANLQMGIVELREMLMSSNAEVEGLREQMMLHHNGETSETATTLNAELVKERPNETPSELHVHHHYHIPEAAAHRKPRKKRTAIAAGHFTPSSGTSTPRMARVREWQARPPSTAATIFSQTSASVPATQMSARPQRYSIQSNQSGTSFAPSSVPSSPGADIFDNIDAALESSRPTSPDCSSLGSPIVRPRDHRHNSKSSYRSFSTPIPLQLQPPPPLESHRTDPPTFAPNDLPDASSETIFPLNISPTHKEPEYQTSNSYFNPDTTPNPFDPSSARPTLRRPSSHDSLISISGMDIHTLRSRPSQRFTGTGFTPSSLRSPTTPISATSLLSPTIATVRPALQRWDQTSGMSSSALLAAHARSSTPTEGKGGLGRLVGGWVWGRSDSARSESPKKPPSTKSLESSVSRPGTQSSDGSRTTVIEVPKPKVEVMSKAAASFFEARSPGVNQKGVIPGFYVAKTPSEIEPRRVDRSLLSEILEADGA